MVFGTNIVEYSLQQESCMYLKIFTSPFNQNTVYVYPIINLITINTHFMGFYCFVVEIRNSHINIQNNLNYKQLVALSYPLCVQI